MPELPEVETVRRGLHAHVVGRKIVSATQLHPRALNPKSIDTLDILSEARWVLWTNIFSGVMSAVHVKDELTPEEADIAYGIGLSVWGVSEAKAKKIMSRKLEFTPSTGK